MLFYVAPSGLIQTVRTPLKPNTIVQSFNLSIIQLFRAKDAFGGHINRVHALSYGYVALTGIKCIFWGKMIVKMLFFGGFLREFAQFAL